MYTKPSPIMYTTSMDITITDFRRNLFDLVHQAMNGVEVHVTHKGTGFTVTPDRPVAADRLSRITPMKIINGSHGSLDGANEELMAEMTAEWERDWAEL